MTQGYGADRWPAVPQDRPWGSWLRAKVPSPEAAGARHPGYFCQPCFPQTLPLLTTAGCLPTRPQTQPSAAAIPGSGPPLHPGELITSDPRSWVNPFLCLPQSISFCPHTQKGTILEPLEDGGLLSKADAFVHPCMAGLSSGSRTWPQVEWRV